MRFFAVIIAVVLVVGAACGRARVGLLDALAVEHRLAGVAGGEPVCEFPRQLRVTERAALAGLDHHVRGSDNT